MTVEDLESRIEDEDRNTQTVNIYVHKNKYFLIKNKFW